MKARLLTAAALTLALSACATGPGYYGPRDSGYSNNGYQDTRCANCGRVERIEQYRGDQRTTGTGAVVGGIVGGVLGNTVGKGDGRTAATIVGAVAGAAVGNEVERDNNSARTFKIFVRMDDGRKLWVTQGNLGNIREGSIVQIDGGRARLIR